MDLYVPVDYAIGSLRFRLEGDSQEMVITLGLKSQAAPDTAEDMADNLNTAALAAGSIVGVASGMYDQWTYVGTTVRLMTATGFDTGEHIENQAGTATGETLPNNCAILVKKNTGLGGRHYRGRLYQPIYGVLESNIDNTGRIGAADVTSLQGRYNTFRTALDTNDLDPYLLHYPFVETPVEDPPVFIDEFPDPTLITTFTVQDIIATQRRRLRR